MGKSKVSHLWLVGEKVETSRNQSHAGEEIETREREREREIEK